MANKHEITAADIMPLDAYGKVRTETRRKLSERIEEYRLLPRIEWFLAKYNSSGFSPRSGIRKTTPLRKAARDGNEDGLSSGWNDQLRPAVRLVVPLQH